MNETTSHQRWSTEAPPLGGGPGRWGRPYGVSLTRVLAAGEGEGGGGRRVVVGTERSQLDLRAASALRCWGR